MINRHPSLNLPFAGPQQLRPAKTMDRNDRCWCGSGKKWKNCHRDRELQSPVNIYEAGEAIRASYQSGTCLYPGAASELCVSRAISSHTIQRRGGLQIIQEDGHVLTIKPNMDSMMRHAGYPPPRSIGVRGASTFPGFCSIHDAAVFKPIDDEKLSVTSETAFLLAYRSICYEYFAKAAALRASAATRDADRGQPFTLQVEIQQQSHFYEAGLRRGLADLTKWKAEYDRCLLSKSFGDFHYVATTFSPHLPIVASAAWYPEYDFAGCELQKIARDLDSFEHIAFNLTTIAPSSSVAIFGWLGDARGPSRQFVDSFQAIPAQRKASAIIRTCFEQAENIYFAKSWWNSLPKTVQESLLARVWSGTTRSERQADCLKDDGNPLFESEVAREELG